MTPEQMARMEREKSDRNTTLARTHSPIGREEG
jgi:hypothetical protein